LREQFNRDKSYLEMLFGLALDAQWLLNQRDLSQGLVSLQRRYRRRLADLALSTYRGRVDRDKLLSRFKKMYSVDLLKLLHCELDEGTEDCWLVRLAHKPDNAQHPLHHLLLIHCLEQNAEMFFHLPTENKPFGDGPWPCLNPTCHHYRQPQVCECIITYSPNVSGRPVGVFSCTCGFAYLRTGPDTTQEDRFKMSGVQAFGYIWEEKISRLWSDETVSLREMSRQLGVDPLTVKRHASRLNLPFPRPTSRTCQIDEKQKLRSPVTGTPGPITLEAYRTSWLEAIQAYQAKGIKFLRSQVPNTYTWLYRNDSVWLKAHLPLSKVDRKCREIRVDWQKRDEQLTEMVEASANRLRHQAGKPTQITLAAIGRDIGQLALLQQHLPKLPVTGRLLKDIIETREAFAIRRIQWIAKQYEGEQLRPRKWEFIKKAGVERIAMVPQVKEALEAALQNWHLNLADRQNVCC